MTPDKDGFIVAVVRMWRAHGCTGIFSADFQALLIKHGLSTEGPATEEDCKTKWGQDYGVELGDMVLHDHPDLVALMKDRAA